MDIERIEQENSEQEVLEFLTQHGYIEGAAHGIALQVMAQGRSSLKGKQVLVFDRIAKEYFNLECDRCHLAMPICEIVCALAEGDGLCSWCRKMASNDD